jgi:xeroderma pigmentosum group C-complementing protein
MPPFIPRKRPSISLPAESSRPPPAKKARLEDKSKGKQRAQPRPKKAKKPLVVDSDDSDSDSSLSDVDSDQFEDVSSTSANKPSQAHGDDDDDDEEDIDWEDAAGHAPEKEVPEYKPQSEGPIEVTLRKRDEEDDWLDAVAAKMKKAASKRDKQVRACTHQLHVQFLLWHNAVRNKWISDREVQQILVHQLPPPIKKEVEKWKRASGLALPEDMPKSTPVKSKKRGKQKAPDPRKERDWGRPSERLEKGKPDMSSGDPLISLSKVLAAYWKKKFSITAPGLRKRGYGTRIERKQLLHDLKNGGYNLEQHGERTKDINEFRELARKCEGSRDVGAQLFTALLRGLGIEARLVASLQPGGYGFTKAEQALPKKATAPATLDVEDSSSDTEDVKSISEIAKAPSNRRGRPSKPAADSEASDFDASIVDVTPAVRRRQPQKYDRDNPFPIYWTEAISTITHKILPISPLILPNPVATTPEILSTFEPRGAKADACKTVMCYVVAHSSDGTAKDVTVRYLKKHVFPGKTRGFRWPVEKVPVYNKHGKIKRYEEYDWFKRVMSSYTRPDILRTPADDIEDSTDLVPQTPEKKEIDTSIDTLSSLKSSPDFVLERFLRREEALRPDAVPDRTFTSGKPPNTLTENVYLRSDVLRCLTAESWHKEGRRPTLGELPLKLVPVRAVTLTRKREAEDHLRVTGEKQMQGLYSVDQTEYIIPDPIGPDGKIPKNGYGNIDCFVPSMVPRGAVHIPLKGTVRICKKLEIDFAEAVTGFEFGNKRAVPVCTGVVVAEEHEKNVREAWKVYHDEQKRKEEKKLEEKVLETWRKFVVGLRIRERVRDTYGEISGDMERVDELHVGRSERFAIAVEDSDEDVAIAGPSTSANAGDADEDMGGGFMPESETEDEACGSDLDVSYHPNDDREVHATAEAEGKEKAVETHYPTPSSVSPLRPAVRRKRPGQSMLDDDESDLSDPASSDGNQDALGTSSLELSNNNNPGSAGGSDTSDSSVTSSDDSSNSDEESDSDTYKPTSVSKRNAAKAPAPLASSARPTRRAPTARKSMPKNENASEDGKIQVVIPSSRRTPIAKPKSGAKQASGRKTPAKREVPSKQVTPKRRVLRRDSTLVTSPYFDS